MAKKKLFISHAAKDRGLAEAVVELLQSAIELEPAQILSTPLEEQGCPEGTDLISHIEAQTQGAETTLVLLSQHYMTNRFCLVELGACWSMSRNLIPLLVPPLGERHIGEIISPSMLLKIDSTDDLNRLATRLQQDLGVDGMNLPRWSVEKKNFLKRLPGLISK